jgi:hypothetical protein
MTIEAKDVVATRGNVAIIIWQGNSVFEDIYGEKSVLVSDKFFSYYNS